MQKSRGIMAAKDAELQSVLSPSQFETYDKARDEIKEALISRVGNEVSCDISLHRVLRVLSMNPASVRPNRRPSGGYFTGLAIPL